MYTFIGYRNNAKKPENLWHYFSGELDHNMQVLANLKSNRDLQTILAIMVLQI